MSVCVPNGLLNHATQRDQTSHKGVNKFGKVTVNDRKFFERDLQNNSEKFYDNLKVPPSELYCSDIITTTNRTTISHMRITLKTYNKKV